MIQNVRAADDDLFFLDDAYGAPPVATAALAPEDLTKKGSGVGGTAAPVAPAAAAMPAGGVTVAQLFGVGDEAQAPLAAQNFLKKLAPGDDSAEVHAALEAAIASSGVTFAFGRDVAGRISDLVTRLNGITQDCDDLIDKSQDLERLLKAAEAEVQQKEKDRAEFERLHATANDALQDEKRAKEALQAQLDALSRTSAAPAAPATGPAVEDPAVAGLRKLLAEAAERVNKKEEELQAFKDRLKDMTTDRDDKERERAKFEADLKSVSGKLELTKKNLEDTQRDMTGLMGSLAPGATTAEVQAALEAALAPAKLAPAALGEKFVDRITAAMAKLTAAEQLGREKEEARKDLADALKGILGNLAPGDDDATVFTALNDALAPAKLPAGDPTADLLSKITAVVTKLTAAEKEVANAKSTRAGLQAQLDALAAKVPAAGTEDPTVAVLRADLVRAQKENEKVIQDLTSQLSQHQAFLKELAPGRNMQEIKNALDESLKHAELPPVLLGSNYVTRVNFALLQLDSWKDVFKRERDKDKNERAEMASKLKEIEEALEAKENERSELERQHTAANEIMRKAKEEKEAVEKELAAFKAASSAGGATAAAPAASVSGAPEDAAVVSLKEKLRLAGEQLAIKEAEYSALHEELQKAKKKIEDDKKAYEEASKALQEKNTSILEVNKSFQAQLKEAREKIAAFEAAAPSAGEKKGGKKNKGGNGGAHAPAPAPVSSADASLEAKEKELAQLRLAHAALGEETQKLKENSDEHGKILAKVKEASDSALREKDEEHAKKVAELDRALKIATTAREAADKKAAESATKFSQAEEAATAAEEKLDTVKGMLEEAFNSLLGGQTFDDVVELMKHLKGKTLATAIDFTDPK